MALHTNQVNLLKNSKFSGEMLDTNTSQKILQIRLTPNTNISILSNINNLPGIMGKLAKTKL